MLPDTSGLFCLVDRRDARSAEASALFTAATQLLTHSYVLAELVPLYQVRGMRRAEALSFMVDLLDNPDVEVVWVDEFLHRAALALLHHRADKTYSLCDAVSFVLMRQRGMGEALTTDHHFAQEGFVRLLQP